MPLILSFIIASYVIKEPDSPLAFWSSVIPFTSPLIMMVRLPLGVPWYELLLSGVFLVAGFIFTTWVAARIYRVGVLMYGKKVTFKELAKWFFYYR
jgi:ABC-2 type transport system permease protein